jgi:hypothetical protein
MTNMLNQSTGLPRVNKIKLLVILAITGVVIAATFLRADSDRNQSENNGLAGTWMSNAEPGVPPQLFSFMSDGRLVSSGAITLPTGPTSVELISAGHGEWIRTGNHEFASTWFLIRSGPTVQFTGLVKVTSTFTLNRNSDQLTSAGTVYIYDADNNLLFSFPSPGSPVYKRVIAGQ